MLMALLLRKKKQRLIMLLLLGAKTAASPCGQPGARVQFLLESISFSKVWLIFPGASLNCSNSCNFFAFVGIEACSYSSLSLSRAAHKYVRGHECVHSINLELKNSYY